MHGLYLSSSTFSRTCIMRAWLLLPTLFFVLAIPPASLAGAVLGFAQGNTQNATFDPSTPLDSPGNPDGGSKFDPATTFGIEDFSPGSVRLGTTNGGTLGTSA